LAARPTRGVFQVDGWGELNINVLYGALTGQVGDAATAGEWRLFVLGYHDRRNGVLKTDIGRLPRGTRIPLPCALKHSVATISVGSTRDAVHSTCSWGAPLKPARGEDSIGGIWLSGRLSCRCLPRRPRPNASHLRENCVRRRTPMTNAPW